MAKATKNIRAKTAKSAGLRRSTRTTNAPDRYGFSTPIAQVAKGKDLTKHKKPPTSSTKPANAGSGPGIPKGKKTNKKIQHNEAIKKAPVRSPKLAQRVDQHPYRRGSLYDQEREQARDPNTRETSFFYILFRESKDIQQAWERFTKRFDLKPCGCPSVIYSEYGENSLYRLSEEADLERMWYVRFMRAFNDRGRGGTPRGNWLPPSHGSMVPRRMHER